MVTRGAHDTPFPPKVNMENQRQNRIRRAKFSQAGLPGLLGRYQIEID